MMQRFGNMAFLLFLVVCCLWFYQETAAFLTTTKPPLSKVQQEEQQHTTQNNGESNNNLLSPRFLSRLHMAQENQKDTIITPTKQKHLEVVLFGVGDLRTDDHGGLFQALTNAQQNQKDCQVMPLIILDNASLARIPGAVAHTVDTAQMLVAALQDLKQTLHDQLGMNLQIVSTSQPLDTALIQTLQPFLSNDDDDATAVQIHVCDLGDVDNQMGYGPYAALYNNNNSDDLPNNVQLQTWTNHLRETPWKQVTSLPEKYPNYVQQYGANKEPPLPPISNEKLVKLKLSDPQQQAELSTTSTTTNNNIPSVEELVERLQSTLNLDPGVVQAEINTGMFQTHWGGLQATTIGESQVLQNLKVYIEECQEEDARWVQHSQYVAQDCPRNQRSLEHATYSWFLQPGKDTTAPNTNNLLAGEPMTRYLAAPLLFGTLSPRRLWYSSTRQRPYFTSPLKTLVEGREWHNLLAAKNLRTKPEFQQQQSVGETSYGYWRWHGYLCRYAQSPLTSSAVVENSPTENKEGVLMIHGFGASGTQWAKAMKELSDIVESDNDNKAMMEGLAPDLLGFGECEKPAISYSIYVWDAQVTDFIKEVAVAKQQWDSFIVGGNSIGGFSAASTAANECARVACGSVCSSGAPGSGKCQGVVLMNPAGPIQSREEVQAIEAQSGGDRSKLLTVAQISSMGALPPCKPPARPVARTFGNGLLAYLRPRIQSICKNLYPTNPAAVDKALCDGIERDSLDPGAINVMISGAKLPPPRSMNEMLKADYGGSTLESLEVSVPEVSFDGPVLVATGILDPLNDAKGRSEGLQALREGITFDPINGGHCPHDELPQDVAKSIAQWMKTTVRASSPAASVKTASR